MGRKPKFRPVITRVKLNPEQAVLSCTCMQLGRRQGFTGHGFSGNYCVFGKAHSSHWALNSTASS